MVTVDIRNLLDDRIARRIDDIMPPWTFQIGDGPVVAAAIHSGHELRPDVAARLAVAEAERLREEDPLTEMWTTAGDSSIHVHRSRFEVDLNRPREKAIVESPDDAWGLTIWQAPPPRHVVQRSLEEYDRFYGAVRSLFDTLLHRWNRILVLDLHSYNYRRAGPDKPGESLVKSPDVNVGTGTMDRERWATLVDGFVAALRKQPFQGRQLDVRENVKFQGGFFPHWLHSAYPDKVCVLSLEFKKLFMDEWTATASITAMEELRVAIRNAANAVRAQLAPASSNRANAMASRLPAAAEYVDSEMLAISRTFDWIRAVSPCAVVELWEDYQSSDFKDEPHFRYPDLDIDIASTRDRLLALPIPKIEDTVLKVLLAEKQRELDRQLELIELRATEGFLQSSIDLFGVAEADLCAEALHILDVVPADRRASNGWVGADQLVDSARTQFAYYRRQCPDFAAAVMRSRDIAAGLMVSNNTLLVSEQIRLPRDRVDALLHHEIGTHILTWYNGGHQPLRQLQCGLAHYDELQEGLAVLAEYLAGNLSAVRLRTLAGRVVAVRLLTDGATFNEVFETLRSDHEFTGRSAFMITTRVFRGGGLTKDVVYLRGLKELLSYLREGHPFEQLLVGKFSLSELPAIKQLEAAGRLEPPKMLPAYLHDAAAQRRLMECTEVPLDGLYQTLVA